VTAAKATALFGMLALTLCGCVQTTAGEAHRAGGNIPAGTVELERFLLKPDRIDEILGAQDIEVIDTATTLAENRSKVSDPDCLGALYNAEQTVYADSGWTAVADQVLADQSDDDGHWMQQSVVAFGSADQALDFFNRSVQDWSNCIGKQVTVSEDDNEFSWRVEGISINGQMMAQTARQEDAGEWACQHALGAAGNHIVEVAACGESIDDQAVRLAGEIARNIG